MVKNNTVIVRYATPSEGEDMLQSMRVNFDLQDSPEIGIFWYNTRTKKLFGVQKCIACDDMPFKSNKKFYSKFHKTYWAEQYSKQNPQFRGPDYTLTPRGRVTEMQDKGFELYVGSWFNKHPNVLDLVKDEFNLADVTVVIDSRLDIGQDWDGDI